MVDIDEEWHCTGTNDPLPLTATTAVILSLVFGTPRCFDQEGSKGILDRERNNILFHPF